VVELALVAVGAFLAAVGAGWWERVWHCRGLQQEVIQRGPITPQRVIWRHEPVTQQIVTKYLKKYMYYNVPTCFDIFVIITCILSKKQLI